MNKNPSDGYILAVIFKSYYKKFISYDDLSESREPQIYVPIDIEAMANKLGMDKHLLFGRLYYHLDKQYRYEQDDGSKVHLFALKVGKDRHVVNFPLLAAVSAEHTKSFMRFMLPVSLSILALFISGAALYITAFK